MCYPVPLRPGATAAGTWHSFGLRKFRTDKIREKALTAKTSNNKIGKMLHRWREGRGRGER